MVPYPNLLRPSAYCKGTNPGINSDGLPPPKGKNVRGLSTGSLFPLEHLTKDIKVEKVTIPFKVPISELKIRILKLIILVYSADVLKPFLAEPAEMASSQLSEVPRWAYTRSAGPRRWT